MSAPVVCGQGTLVYQRYCTPNPDPNFPWDYEGRRVLSLYPTSMTIDINQDGTPDYLIGTGGAQSTSGFYIYGLQQANKVWGASPFDSQWAVALTAGEVIGDDGHPSHDWFEPTYHPGGAVGGPIFTASVGDLGPLGFYTGVESAYCGLQMEVNGETHYGWVRVGSPIGLNGGWVYDSVFNNNPGESLLAGAGMVPEPSTVTLILLGGGVILLRGKRK
jgi:hypothetical protein